MLKKLFTALTLSLILAFASAAQTPEFKIMGRVDLLIDGVSHELIIPWETARGRGHAKISKRLSTQIINVNSINLYENGRLGNPRLSLAFHVSKGGTRDGLPVLVSMELTDAQGIAMPAVADGQSGSIALSDLELVGTESVAVSFSGELAREDWTDILDTKIVEGAAPVVVSGSLKTVFFEPD